jgi:peroxiredoxin
MLAVGSVAPLFGGTAVFFNHPFSLQVWRGQPVLLLFGNHRTAPQTQQVARALRQKYPQHTAVLLVVIVDLQAVPRLLRGMARTAIEAALGDAIQQIPPEYNPVDHLIVLPDWQGDICHAYRAQHIDQHMALALIDSDGRIHATYQGAHPSTHALELVTNLLHQPPPTN